jgi:hypothetical protein
MSKDIYSFAKLLGASNITDSPLAKSIQGRQYLNERSASQTAEQNLQTTQTPLGAISGGIALYLQRKRENKALEDLNAQMQAEDAARIEKRQSLVNVLPEEDRQMANFLDDANLQDYVVGKLKPVSEKDKLAIENDRLQNRKLQKEISMSDQVPQGKPLTAPALKMQNEALDIIGTAKGINADLGAVEKQLDSDQIKLGPIENLKSQARNYAGFSSPESRNFSSFKATLEKQRNDSLRLNKGVQTEGDAQRAWNELFNNLNDKEVVKQRLQEIQKINERAADLQKLQVDQIRANFGAPPVEFDKFERRPAALGNGGQSEPTRPSQQNNNTFQSSNGVKFTIKR